MSKLGLTLFAALALQSLAGCHEAHKIEDKTRCREICSQANECDNSIDTDTCTDQCGEDANIDGGYETKLDDCASCVHVTDNCTENYSNCAERCSGVVTFKAPASTGDGGAP